MINEEDTFISIRNWPMMNQGDTALVNSFQLDIRNWLTVIDGDKYISIYEYFSGFCQLPLNQSAAELEFSYLGKPWLWGPIEVHLFPSCYKGPAGLEFSVCDVEVSN